MIDANELLLGSIGGKAAKFENFGDRVSGTILAEPRSEQQTIYGTETLAFDEQGRPMMQIIITLQTQQTAGPEDDGVRTIYVKGSMLRTIGKAMVDAGARKLEIGGQLAVEYKEDIPARNPKHKPAKNFSARYAPPAPQASQILAQAAVQPDFAGQAPRTGGTVFENQHRNMDAGQRSPSTLDQMRNASQGNGFTGEIPF